MKIFNLRIVKNEEYEDLKIAWEKQNKEIDLLSKENASKQKRIDTLETIAAVNEKTISDKIKKLHEKDVLINSKEELIQQKEQARLKNAAAVGGYAKENHKLKDKINQLEEENRQLKDQNQQLAENKTQLEKTNDFLKNHRRAPDIEEIKDYTQNRKRRRNRKLKG